MTLYPLAWIAFAFLCAFLAFRAMRGKWDLLASHARDLTRHALALLLMTGTLAGTLYTFSNGRLTLDGWLERILSVGGIAAALELGAIFCGSYVSQLDARIQTARRREVATQLRAYRKIVLYWFAGVVGISVLANLIFRIQQLGNFPIALFVSLAPAILIVLFTIVLRRLPVDYQEKRRSAVGRTLFHLVEESERTLSQALRMTARGHTLNEAQTQGLQLASAIIRMGAQADEQHMLDHAMIAIGGAQAGAVVEGDVYWTSGDIRSRYGVSSRTAQVWMQSCPGRRKRERGNQWEVPASVIRSSYGAPPAQLPDPMRAQTRAGETHASADDAQLSASEPQPTAANVTASSFVAL